MDSVEQSAHFCNCLDQFESVQRATVNRGTRHTMFSVHKYCCVGQQPSLSRRGVHPTVHHKLIPISDYCFIVKVMKRYEKAYFIYCDSNKISRIFKARKLVPFKTMGMEMANDNVDGHFGTQASFCEVFGAMAFGKNNHLRYHVDDDFCHSILTVHVNGKKYEHDDAIVVFLFPKAWSCCFFTSCRCSYI